MQPWQARQPEPADGCYPEDLLIVGAKGLHPALAWPVGTGAGIGIVRDALKGGGAWQARACLGATWAPCGGMTAPQLHRSRGPDQHHGQPRAVWQVLPRVVQLRRRS